MYGDGRKVRSLAPGAYQPPQRPRVQSVPAPGTQPQPAPGPEPKPAPDSAPQQQPAPQSTQAQAPPQPGIWQRVQGAAASAREAVGGAFAKAGINAARHEAADAIANYIASTNVTPERLLMELQAGRFGVGLLIEGLRAKLGPAADQKLDELRAKFGGVVQSMGPDDYLAIIRDDALSGRFPRHARMFFDNKALFCREMEAAKRYLAG